ncbi:citramalate synthase [Paenibacillus dendritiformis]|uniref:Citramalate synthase n=1 Tax=Paenibacillus dendritiformis C454 TaxID=1131935 RepID=H3SQ83_9BACL|nr:citramalate synthase [Paenibacillus dendritiformis]EHQ58767.1 putative alpha-isopropylmalate/homocitrate synthase family transferase [Paenibacillus dendritiformis C454]CAH8772068.1 citramalate synthase [Paenibacillus dendritiformis]
MSTFVSIFDTTLRDGTQGEGISLSADDKIKIARKLNAFGVSYIEGGIPGSNGKDIEFFKRVKSYSWQAKLTAFGSTRRKMSRADQDVSLNRIIEAGVPAATLVGKSWDFHVHTALETTLEENLAMISDSIAYLKRAHMEVMLDAEHFFDGYKHNPEYALAVLRTAEEAGADWVVMCDTNGGTLPHEIASIVRDVKNHVNIKLGIHTHNDCELAVANTLAAVEAGATQVQGTMNGYGERCGNANLCSIIPNLQLKMGYSCVSADQLKQLTSVARYVSEIANVNMPVNQPYVGNAAFAHKGGIHVSAIMKDSRTYEHIKPEQVGNKQRVLVSELAGQSNVLSKAQQLGYELDASNPNTRAIIERIKELEHQGYQFEGADASLELLLRQATGTHEEPFTFASFKMLVEKSADRSVNSEAIVKLNVGNETVYMAAEGNGPVNALDNALRKALVRHYPFIEDMHLTDYKVRVLDENDTTAAKVRVLIESTDSQNTWSTVGVSSNVIEASWEALVDSIRYALIGKEKLELEPERREPLGLVNH